MAVFESVFDIAYLCFDVAAGVLFFALGKGRPEFLLYGILALLLGAGDAFHLVPRVRRYRKGEEPDTEYRLGLGLKVSSITMTVYYLLLYAIFVCLEGKENAGMAAALFIAAAVRIVLCLFPQNNWYRYEGNARWSLYRNIPFAVVGICMIILYIMSGSSYGRSMAVAVAVSFACYLPVTVFARKYPAVGSLMIPKTIAYVWMLAVGLKML